jgi:HK97 family phage portal protein
VRSALAPLARLRPANRSTAGDPPVPYSSRRTGDGLSVAFAPTTTVDAQLRTYSQIPAVYAAVSELAEATGQVDWHLYQRSASGSDEDRVEITPARGHAALDLWAKPNPFMSRSFFVEYTQLHLDLAGETFIVIGTDGRATSNAGRLLPLTLWPVSPAAMTPVPHPQRFLAGYVYTDPDGQKVPFGVDEVIHVKYPNPLDPYRGLSPVAALMPDLESSRAATEWNRRFFLNDATPGGIIEMDEDITDDEFDELEARWRRQHQGTGNAHRVAILSHGMRWKDRAFTMRDLQFTELRRAGNEQIMLGFKVGKTLLGQTEGVNRATAEAAEYVFGKYRVVRRLNRYREMLNDIILPAYSGGERLEFDYDSPVTANVEEQAKDRDSRVSAAVALIGVGFDPQSVVDALDLPAMTAEAAIGGGAGGASPRDKAEMIQKIYLGVGTVVTWEEARDVLREAGMELGDVPAPAPAAPAGPFGALTAAGGVHAGHRWPVRPRAAGDPPAELPPSELPDVTPLQRKFDTALDELLARWTTLEDRQKADLVAQVLAIATAGRISDLTGLSVDTSEAAALLAEVMADIGDDAADAVVREAAEQGVEIEPVAPDRVQVDDVAAVVAALIGARLAAGAAAAAMRANGPAVTAAEVADRVRDHLAGLSVDGPRPQLAGALTGTQNEARLSTLRRAPEGALYSSEINDANTCGPCAAIDGKWLGNISDIDEVSKLYPGGAYGGYVDCKGRERCRGTITGVWRRQRS